MKNKIQKYPFNMVEIALAMAIIAIGLSGILVLFPVGINASKSAIADNNLADIAEYIMGYLQAGCNADWIWLAENPTPVTYPFTDTLATETDKENWENDPFSKGKDGFSLDANGDSPDFPDNIEGGSSDALNNLRKGSEKGVFLYRQISNGVVDFAAVVRVWKEDVHFWAPSITGALPDKFTDTSSSLKGYAQNLCIEISWPIEMSYADREKRIFRLEIFNQAYKLPVTSSTP